jgi:hypothetical protein
MLSPAFTGKTKFQATRLAPKVVPGPRGTVAIPAEYEMSTPFCLNQRVTLSIELLAFKSWMLN